MKYLILAITLAVFSPENACEEYEASVVSVYDGDTVTCDIEVGFNIHMTERIRLYGIDAPEVRGSEKVEGFKSRDALRGLILNEDVQLINHGRGKYGRVIGEIVVHDTIYVSDWLVENDYAIYKEY